MKQKILIQNGRVFMPSTDIVTEVFIEDGKITAIGPDLLKSCTPDETIDARGLYVLPGGIDAHTHMELPFMGTFSSDDFESGTLAGLYGGTTSIIDFAIQSKGESLTGCVNQWHEKARSKAVADYAFHVAVTDYNEKIGLEIPEIIQAGVPSFKAFMAYKGSLMIDDQGLSSLLSTAARHGGLVSVHAENGDVIDALVAQFRAEGKMAPQYHALAHPASAEEEAAGRAMDLALAAGAELYIVHTTCRDVLELAAVKSRRGQRIFVETCPQYLLLDDSCYLEPDFGGAKYVMSPPIRKKEDQEALWQGIESGLVQVVGTDHCPFNMVGQKDRGKDDFSKIPNGAPGIENRLEICFSEGVKKNRISMRRFVEVMCSNPAEIFGLSEKGAIRLGADADLVLFDPEEKHTLSVKTHHQHVDYNTYEGLEVTGKVRTVISNGAVAIRDGRADQIEKGRGRFIRRQSRRTSCQE
ncbi:dihydropyrimidinase [Myxococcota bacterium]|nr:dihydropyrimidinase [Myxococcota bacterium]MBU1413575.1 dihydropyrimidinase [Myxococcota bacterium]MBU1510603.1 dihydropyrimidinase [Myxococcota bacterium]